MFKMFLVGGVITLIIFSFIYGIYQWNRSWNYKFGYESRVKETVCEMVKPEYLKSPDEC